MLKFIYLFYIICFFSIVKSFYRYFKVKKFLSKEIKIKNEEYNKKIEIIIPVYYEEEKVEESIVYFMQFVDICNVNYVTTSREIGNGTYHKILELIKKYDTKNIFVYNCPNLKGVMAHQINYVARKMNDDAIIGVYNVDSFPDSRSFEYVIDKIEDKMIFQQISYFDDKKLGILNSAQKWQNRWSLIYEMGKCLEHKNFNNFMYTIGHGIFIKKRTLAELGYWSEIFINEDNELGYRATCNGVKIYSIPYLEKCGFAKNIKIYIKQQSVWYNGPLYAFSYIKRLTIKNVWYACLNFKAALSWLLGPIITFLIILFDLLSKNYFDLMLLIFLLFIYISVINQLVENILDKLDYVKRKKMNFILTDITFYFIHAIGPMLTLIKCILNKNTQENKYKTEK